VAVAAVQELNRTGPPVEILSVDSMQVYRGMDIGTAKATPEQQAEIPHHLIDLVDPDTEFTVTAYQAAARDTLEAIESRGHRALLVGGSGLYFNAITDQLTPPGRYPDIKAELDANPDTEALYERLNAIDPLAASRMQPTNRRRIVRALEVTLGSGRPFSSFGPGIDAYPPTRFRIAGLWLPRPVVAARIAARFDAMMAEGLVEEVRRLAKSPTGLSRTARQALGYREILAHLEQEQDADLDKAKAETIRRTRAFARRQRVWWRRDPRITWFGASENPLAVMPAVLRDWTNA
jgi:tRNA dimethylallyltransferase